MDPKSVEVTQQLLTRHSVANNFFMAHTEFRDLASPPPWRLFEDLGERLHLLG